MPDDTQDGTHSDFKSIGDLLDKLAMKEAVMDELTTQIMGSVDPVMKALLKPIVDEPDIEIRQLLLALIGQLQKDPSAVPGTIRALATKAPNNEGFWIIRGLPFATGTIGEDWKGFAREYIEAETARRTEAFTTILDIAIDLMMDQVLKMLEGKEPFPILMMEFLSLSRPQELRVLLMLTHKNIMEKNREGAETFFALAETRWPEEPGVLFLQASREQNKMGKDLTAEDKKAILEKMRYALSKAGGEQARLLDRMIGILESGV